MYLDTLHGRDKHSTQNKGPPNWQEMPYLQTVLALLHCQSGRTKSRPYRMGNCKVLRNVDCDIFIVRIYRQPKALHRERKSFVSMIDICKDIKQLKAMMKNAKGQLLREFAASKMINCTNKPV